ncbi:MAG: 8-oxo-dGTP diphosphatase MutT [Anaerovoracaceae bacterium]
MKTIHVVAAIIRRQQGDTVKIFSTQRGYGEFKGGWEFPGGKIEPGETPEQALVREIQEELNITVQVGRLVDMVEYDYPAFHLSMHCFICELAEDDSHLELREHEAARWLARQDMDSVDWLPADQGVADKLKADDAVWGYAL